MAPNQIAFFPQSSGGGGGAMQLAVPKVTATGSQNAITLSAIPQTFTHLLLIVSGTNTAGTTENVTAQFSGDTGANYSYNYILNNNGTGTFGNVASNQTSMLMGELHGFGGSMIRAFIGGYSQTTLGKSVELSNFALNPTFTYANVVLGGVWNNLAALTSITLTLASGNFTAGTIISLYGLL